MPVPQKESPAQYSKSSQEPMVQKLTDASCEITISILLNGYGVRRPLDSHPSVGKSALSNLMGEASFSWQWRVAANVENHKSRCEGFDPTEVGNVPTVGKATGSISRDSTLDFQVR